VTTTRTFTRRCKDCGDVRELRYDWHQPAGSTVVRRCKGCAAAANLTQGPVEYRFTETPRDDIDDVMVDRIMGGRAGGANVAERLEATARLAGLYRLPASLIAERLGVTPRTVQRYRRELRDTGRLAA